MGHVSGDAGLLLPHACLRLGFLLCCDGDHEATCIDPKELCGLLFGSGFFLLSGFGFHLQN